jgi:hypothetical protein
MRRIQSMQEVHGVRHFNFLPYSVSLPREYETLREEMDRDPYQWWIIKPSSSSQGKGIIITNKIKDVFDRKDKCQIASHYISNPLLIDGLKFDMRIYVALTSVDPLRIYMYEEGLTRFATTSYMTPGHHYNINNKKGKYAHLTNYSINKNNKSGFV